MYALLFPRKGTSDYVMTRGMSSLKAVTACLWMKTADTGNAGTPLSYAVSGRYNELLLFDYNNFLLFLGNSHRYKHVQSLHFYLSLSLHRWVKSIYLLCYLVVVLLYLQTMESGTTSAMRGRIPLDHGSCTKMARLQLLEKVSKQVRHSTLDSYYCISLPNGDFYNTLTKSSKHFTEQNSHCNHIF